jgi:hypothetical protein
LTDGLNTQDRRYSSQSSINNRQQKTCDNIKAAGLTMYTVQVNTGGDATSSFSRTAPVTPASSSCSRRQGRSSQRSVRSAHRSPSFAWRCNGLAAVSRCPDRLRASGAAAKLPRNRFFQCRTNRVLRTPHKNVRHLRDLRKTAFTIEGIEKAATKPNRHPKALPPLGNSAPLTYRPFSTKPYQGS